MRLLVIEDHAETRALVSRALSRDGHVVTAVGTAADALAALRDKEMDVVVLDLGLPDASGASLCATLRDDGHEVPLLVLTAQGAVSCRVECLDAGADDFLAKPFAVAELRARVRALGRRRAAAAAQVLRRGDVVLDFTARTATVGDAPRALTAREWSVLERLALEPGRVVSRATLLEEIWGDVDDAHGASLEVIVVRIRKKLGVGVVRTVRGGGYVLA